VAEVAEIGGEGLGWAIGDLVGIPWLYRACGECRHCRAGDENLCDRVEFTGFHHDGGYGEYMLADARFALKLPSDKSPEQVAPLLCAGIIGYRSLKKAELQPGERVGLVGFGASAHLAIQVALHWGCEVYVFTRSESHQRMANDLGATWVGGSVDLSPVKLDRAIIFAPAGELVPPALATIRPGGTVAINAIHMSTIPEMPYELIYGERILRSVANATVKDGVEFLELASIIPIQARVTIYDLEHANEALGDLKESKIDGAAVLQP
jgi:propanol-preferring alcohol dehydrogenase